MVIIQLAGGLGNQMFQYALYLQLKSLGRDVKIDDVSGFVEDRQRVPVLAPFGAVYERAERKELRKMLDSSPLLHARIRRKLCGRRKKSYFEEDKRYRPAVLEWDDIYLEGYWQTEKYFKPVSKQVREIFDADRLRPYLEERLSETGRRILEDWQEKIAGTESVSVHIRRGDYLLPQNQALFGGICTEEYYRTAMERMRKEHPDCTFYLFSNDKKWAAEWAASIRVINAQDGGSGKVEKETERAGEDRRDGCVTAMPTETLGTGETGTEEPADVPGIGRIEIVDLTAVSDVEMDRDYAEFLLMSKCGHAIMANSSFSWWASYLNRNPHKTVYAPDRWLNGWDCEDMYREDMQRIRCHGRADSRS